MTNNNDTHLATLKVMAAWVAWVFGSATLSQFALGATLVYTLLQIFILVRDKLMVRTKE